MLNSKDTEFLKAVLKYLLYKMGEEETPIKKILRKRRIEPKPRTKPEPKLDYNTLTNKRLLYMMGPTQESYMPYNMPVG